MDAKNRSRIQKEVAEAALDAYIFSVRDYQHGELFPALFMAFTRANAEYYLTLC